LVPIGIIAIIFSYNIFIYTKYIKSYDHPQNPFYSNAIYDLIQYTKESKDSFVSVDWGTHAQLLAFNGVPGKYVQLAFWLNDLNDTNFREQDLNLLLTYLTPDNNYYFIMHPVNTTFFIKARQNIFAAAARYKMNLNLQREITDNGGRVIYEIYNVKKQLD